MAKKKQCFETNTSQSAQDFPAAQNTEQEETETTVESKKKNRSQENAGFPIVGVGASAGGLLALRKLLEAMPDEPGVGLVIIQHLDPTKKSLAAEILGKYTNMRVCEVDDEPVIAPNRIWVIPPNKYLSISGGELNLSDPQEPRGARMAIDVFLRSLAEDQRECAVAVILSGTGSDGSLGVKAIKSAGGLVIAQDPSSAEHDGMPRSAIATATVDHILQPADIPAVLVRYAQHGYVREAPTAAPTEDDVEIGLPPDGLNAFIELLRAHTKHDFRNYKETTLIRRMRRRMCLYHLDAYDDYLMYLRGRPEEIELLAKDLLITVTDFFREPEAWEQLRRRAIRPLVEAKADDASIRVWTAGCATGEEPYSVAMLILEELWRAEKSCPLHVFASDIDKDAIHFARAGRYPKSIQADVSHKQLTRFFTCADGDEYYRVNKLLRETVVFAEQNLIGDPPFSQLDLICCRNLLIYLKAEIQEKVIALFHFALREGGVLFLGSAETIGQETDLFQTMNKRWRIFRRIGPTHHDRVDIPLTTAGHRHEIEATPAQPLRSEARLTRLAQQRLLDLLAPCAALIDRNWQILYICGNVDPYLTLKSGVPTDNLLDHARRGLRTKLRGAVHAALSERRTISVQAKVYRNSGYAPVTVVVRVIYDRNEKNDLALILFDEENTSPGRQQEAPVEIGGAPLASQNRGAETDMDEDAVIGQLEEELADVKENLQFSIEQFEASNEEFKAANEEVMSVNEELQSTNEELETSKEELQSLNEELSTVNNQLAAKVDELETKHADLENLISVTDMATICLDTDLAVRWFTPAAQHVIRLKPADIGRPLADFTHEFINGDLVKMSARVLSNLTPIEDEVTCHDGRTLLRRITPYRTEDHRLGGAVITFIDITRRKQDEEKLRKNQEQLRIISDSLPALIAAINAEQRYLWVNRAFAQQFRRAVNEIVGQKVRDVLGEQNYAVVRPHLESALTGEQQNFEFALHLSGSDEVRVKDETYVPHRTKEGRVIGCFGLTVDITERKRTEEARARLAAIVESTEDAIIGKTLDGIVTTWNRGAEILYGYTAEEMIGQPITRLVPEERVDEVAGILDGLRRGELIKHFETVRVGKNGSLHDVSLTISPIHDTQGKIVGGSVIARDITDPKKTEKALCESEERLRLATEGAEIGIWEWNFATDEVFWNELEGQLVGCAPFSNVINVQEFYNHVHPEDLAKLRRACDEAIEKDTPYNHEFRVIRADGKSRWLAGKGEVFRDDTGKPARMMGVNFDISDRKRMEAELRDLNESLEDQVRERTEMLHILQDITRAANEARTVEDAMRAALERIAQYNGWQVGHVCLLADDARGRMASTPIWYITETAEQAVERLEEFQQISEQKTFSEGEGLIGAVMESGKPKWLDDIAHFDDWQRNGARQLGLHAAIAFPVTVYGKVVAVLEFFSDHPAKREQRFLEIMPDVGIQLGHVIERKRLEMAVDTAVAEQMRSIAQELHDGVAQQLTGIAMMGEVLRERMKRVDTQQSELVENLVNNLHEAQDHVRLLSHGLMPVEIDAEGLMQALRLFLKECDKIYSCECRFHCDELVALEYNQTATHLYRIAQEAIQNAIKHGDPKHIDVYLTRDQEDVILTVKDDGDGFPVDDQRTEGRGLRIMQHRASLIGARLNLESKEGVGVTVTCRVRTPRTPSQIAIV